jgi:putative FmdB family regulatory protein
MPNYDYRCESCGHEFEEMLRISKREEPTKIPCQMCEGKVNQSPSVPYFGYDNIKTKYSKKEPGWFTDRMKDIKRNVPGNTL